MVHNTVVTQNDEIDDMENSLKDLDTSNLSDAGKKKIAETWSLQKIEEYITYIQNNKLFDDQKKQDILNNMMAVRTMRDQLDQEKAEDIEQQSKKTEEIQTEKKTQKDADLQQVDELKKLLSKKDEKIDFMENQIKSLQEELTKISVNNYDALVSLKDAKKSQDKDIIKKIQENTILRLLRERKALRDKYVWELPKYEWNIQTLETKWIELKLFGNDSVNWQRVLSWPQLRFRQNLHSRKRINTTVKRLNDIWSDPKKWVDFVLTRTFGYDPLSVSWKIWTGFKNMKKFFKIRDVQTFDEMYDKQKKYFIDDLESKMDANSMSEQDKKVIAAIKNRLDYYQKAYKRQFIVA